MEKECAKHGLTEFTLRKDGYYRCKKCGVENVQRRRDKVKMLAVAYKGGKCQNPKCGYHRYVGALDFHHIDPSKKDFGISHKGYTRSWERVKAELDKCVMVCANCHSEIHAGLLQVNADGTISTGE